MAANDFLPFADAGGADVLTQAAYASLAARTAGFATGIANSTQLNKVWRQSSVMASALAQVLSNAGNAGAGVDLLDDGNISTLINSIVNGLRSGHYNLLTRGGSDTANILTGTFAPAPPTLAALDHMEILVPITATNTGPVTLNVNGLGACAILDMSGNALLANSLVAGSWARVTYRAGSSVFFLTTPMATPFVKQGGTAGQLTNQVYIGWSAAAKLKATVDTTDLGNIALESWVTPQLTPYRGKAAQVVTSFVPASSGATTGTLNFTPLAAGYFHVTASVNVGSGGVQPVGGDFYIFLNGAVFAHSSTIGPMTLLAVYAVAGGSNIAVQCQYVAGASGGTFVPMDMYLSYVFVAGP